VALQKSSISLGFTDQDFPAGIHVCQIISENEERQESLLKFLVAGIKEGERACCFSEHVDEALLKEFFNNYNISFNDVIDSGALMVSGVKEIYFQGNCFNPDTMLGLLKNYHDESEEQGYQAARVIGEMSPEVQDVPGGDRLLEYESRVSQLLQEYPVTAVCQYDARLFDGATIMEVLKVHPYMVVRGSIVNNPFYISPEEYLAEKSD